MAPFNYTFTANPKIGEIYNSLLPKPKVLAPSSPGYVNPLISSSPNFIANAVPFSSVNRTLPAGGGTYQSPVVAQPSAPVAPKAPAISMPQAGVQSPTQPLAPGGLDYSKYSDPMTGRILSPDEYAESMAKRATGGSIPAYAGDALTGGMQTREQIVGRATDLNNERNDLATGTADPYKVASQSGIAYSPGELAAIEKAYAGIYDPALKEVFAKLDKKDKEDAAALERKNNLEEMAQQHKYDLELKKTAPGQNPSTTTTSGIYAPGENPTVDAWAQRIFEGGAKITDIPASDKGLRNAVTVALQSYGNQSDGRPTTTEIGKQTLDAAKRLKVMFDAGEGTSTVGKSRIFTGGLAIPGTDAANFKNLYNTLIANRSLEGIKFLKGQGAVSDAERETLKAAMSELNLNQGEDAFAISLQSIIDKLEGNTPSAATSGGAVLRSPDGTQEVSVADLTPAELEEARVNGWK